MIGDAVLRFSSRYTVTRFGPAVYVDGRAQAPVPVQVTVDAVVQPTPKGLQRPPEGERSSEVVVIFTTVSMVTSDAKTGRIGDRITYQGRTYEVESSEDWTTLGGYFRSEARKVEL